VIHIFNTASTYIIYHTYKLLINTIKGLGSLFNSLLLRQSELYHLHPLNFCITIAALICLSNYYTVNKIVHFII